MTDALRAFHGDPAVKATYLARVAAIKGGLPVETPALTLNRLCGSGLQAIVSAAQVIQLPVAVASSAVHWFSGALDLRLGCVIGLVLLAGSLAGQQSGRRMDTQRLQWLLAVLLLAVGAWFAWLALH